MKTGKIAQNTIALYAMNIAKMIMPLVTLPYLTRVLSKDCYGVVAYVKAVMQYMQLFVDFGFLYSGVKDIVAVRDDARRLGEETGNIFVAKILLGGMAGCVLLVLIPLIPILRANAIYTLLSFAVVFLTCFLFDHFFRGIERMHVITIRFVVMKSIAAALTFVFVKSDADIVWISLLDILGTLVAIAFIVIELKRLDVRLRMTGLKTVIVKIRDSAVYFVSDVATTVFGALNTLVIGICLSESDVASWSLCMQLVGAVQAMYTPLTNGVYPAMVKTKSIRIIKNLIKIFLPIVIAGCAFTFVTADWVVRIVGGSNYADVATLLRCVIPLLFFSFPAMVLGWPTLGGIGKATEMMLTTTCAAIAQITGLVVLVAMGQFTLINLAILRCFVEFVLFSARLSMCIRFSNEFSYDGGV